MTNSFLLHRRSTRFRPLRSLLIAGLFTTVHATAAPADSVKVVKGQVSDYFITVSQNRVLTGRVTDETGTPLEGATVMFFASPMHGTTDAEGRYSIRGAAVDTLLYVYYPGKELTTCPVAFSRTEYDVRLRPDRRKIPAREKAIATRWFDPADDCPKTFCNPTNIPYCFRANLPDLVKNGSFRSTADPTIVPYKDDFLLFSTNQSGFYYSKDLSNWEYVFAGFQRYPQDDDQCAPAAYVNGDTLFYTGSTYAGLPVWYSTDPKSGRFKRYIEKITLPAWDPAFLLDDDGKLYLYYGSSNEYALKGVELDRRDMHPVGKIHEIMLLHPQEHGWERFGMNNDDETTLPPFTEGAFVTKHDGKYYFQYGAPGTEFKVYADGVYVSDHPLGPFTYQRHNPMSYKPGGFVQGAGHGGTFRDFHGRYWHVATCMLSLKYKFERRIGIYPAAFDADGVMHASTAFGDYPAYNASENIADPAARFTGWMLLSTDKPVTASSSEAGFSPQAVCDENMRTFWAAASGDPGEWLQMDLGGVKEVRALQLNYYDHKAVQHNRAMDLYHQYRIWHSEDGETWELAADKCDNDRDVPHDYLELREPLRTRYLKVENLHMPTGSFALSGFRVFGRADAPKPSPVKRFRIERDKQDRRNARFSWKADSACYGYNIYYGTQPDKLYNAITVTGASEYDFRGLDRDTEYYFAIEALSESGRSPLGKPVKR